MAPVATPATPGGVVRRVDGADRVVVTIGVMFPAGPPTIAELARRLHLQPEVVLDALLGWRPNAAAVAGLYRAQLGEPVPDLAVARRRLGVEATGLTYSEYFPTGTETPYVNWIVDPDGDRPIVLPVTAAFRTVLADEALERRRQIRLQAIRPDFEALCRDLEAIREQALDLSTDIRTCRILAERHVHELRRLNALDGLLAAMLAHPKEPGADDDRADVERLRTQLQALQREANWHLLIEPADSFRGGLVARRNRDASGLLALVEAAAFLARLRTLADNRDVAPPDLRRQVLDVLTLAYVALLASPQSDRVMAAHVQPMIDTIAAQPIDLTGVASTDPDFDRAIRTPPLPRPENSALVIAARIAGVVPLAAGNYPGPSTFAVGVVEWAVALKLAALGGNRAAAVADAGSLFRFLVNSGATAPLSPADKQALLRAIDEGDLRQLRQVDWTRRMMGGRFLASVNAIAGAICLYRAWTEDDASTLRRWADIVGGATTTVNNVSVALRSYSVLIERGIVSGVAGKALGVVGGVAAVISGTITAQEESASGDVRGAWVAGIGAAAGVVSVAGFLITAGAVTSATVFGAPLGVAMMVVGAAVGIGAGAVQLARGLLTEGSQQVFEAVLNEFGRAEGPFDVAARVRPSLRAAFTTVQEAHHPIEFWDVHPDVTPQLSDLHFSEPYIARIVDESEDEVKTRLNQAKTRAP